MAGAGLWRRSRADGHGAAPCVLQRRLQARRRRPLPSRPVHVRGGRPLADEHAAECAGCWPGRAGVCWRQAQRRGLEEQLLLGITQVLLHLLLPMALLLVAGCRCRCCRHRRRLARRADGRLAALPPQQPRLQAAHQSGLRCGAAQRSVPDVSKWRHQHAGGERDGPHACTSLAVSGPCYPAACQPILSPSLPPCADPAGPLVRDLMARWGAGSRHRTAAWAWAAAAGHQTPPRRPCTARAACRQACATRCAACAAAGAVAAAAAAAAPAAAAPAGAGGGGGRGLRPPPASTRRSRA